jgi:hypothetical protein
MARPRRDRLLASEDRRSTRPEAGLHLQRVTLSVYQRFPGVRYENANPREAVSKLMLRESKPERV